jgi:hypothetical protein
MPLAPTLVSVLRARAPVVAAARNEAPGGRVPLACLAQLMEYAAMVREGPFMCLATSQKLAA